jgi:haloalkane dehalogenase
VAAQRSTTTELRRLGIAPELFPFDGAWIDVGAGRMHVVDVGGGPTVVLLHGNPTWSFYYRRLIPLLAQDFRVIVPDHLGCGLSDRPSREEYGYSLSDRVADLDRLLDALQVGDSSFVVHDWGGMIGLSWIVDHLHRCQRIVALNTAGFGLPEDASVPLPLRLARTPLLGSLLVRGLGLFERGAARRCVVGELPVDVRQGYLAPYGSWRDRLAVHQFVLDIPLRASHRSWDRVRRTAEALSELDPSNLMVGWGMQDFVFDRRFLAAWRSRLPGATYHQFEAAGHYVLEDAFETLAPLIQHHLLQRAQR